MATIKPGYGRDGFGDRSPLVDTVLRDIADDLTLLNGSALAALTSSQNATANATDLPSAQTLANALKVSFNQLQADVAAMRTALNAESGALKTIKG